MAPSISARLVKKTDGVKRAPSAPPRRGAQTRKHETVSEVLARLTTGDQDERLTLADMRKAFGPRSFGLMILLFALPNMLPVTGIPGLSTFTGAALIFFTLQLVFDKPEPYLPRRLMRRSFTCGQLAKIVNKVDPSLRWIERLLAPRLPALVGDVGERLIGLVSFLLALILLLPIPFANALPAAAIAALALALISRDGLLAIVGYIGAAVTAWFLPTLVVAGVKLANELWQRFFVG